MTPIGIPWGTRLVHIERVQSAWRCWTAINSIGAPMQRRRGAFLLLQDDGSCVSVTIHEDGTETMQQVKGPEQ